MERCRYSFLSKLGLSCAVLLTLVAAMLLWASVVISISDGPASQRIVCTVYVLSIAIVIFRFGVIWYRFESRRYQLCQRGITIGRKKVFYPWSQIHEVDLVAIGGNGALDSYETVICCFLSPREDKDLKRLLYRPLYVIRNQDKFLVIDYSDAVLARFRNVCPYEIRDLRREQGITRAPWYEKG